MSTDQYNSFENKPAEVSQSATFETGLKAEYDRNQRFRNSTHGRRVKLVLSLPEGDRRRVCALRWMEANARIHMDVSHDAQVDWASPNIPWADIITLLIKLLPVILAVLGIL